MRRDEVLESGTLGIGDVPVAVLAGAVVSSPSSLRAVEEDEEKDFRTMRCQVSRIAMLGLFPGYVRVRVCMQLSVCPLFGFEFGGMMTRALLEGGERFVVEACGMNNRGRFVGC